MMIIITVWEYKERGRRTITQQQSIDRYRRPLGVGCCLVVVVCELLFGSCCSNAHWMVAIERTINHTSPYNVNSSLTTTEMQQQQQQQQLTCYSLINRHRCFDFFRLSLSLPIFSFQCQQLAQMTQTSDTHTHTRSTYKQTEFITSHWMKNNRHLVCVVCLIERDGEIKLSAIYTRKKWLLHKVAHWHHRTLPVANWTLNGFLSCVYCCHLCVSVPAHRVKYTGISSNLYDNARLADLIGFSSNSHSDRLEKIEPKIRWESTENSRRIDWEDWRVWADAPAAADRAGPSNRAKWQQWDNGKPVAAHLHTWLMDANVQIVAH